MPRRTILEERPSTSRYSRPAAAGGLDDVRGGDVAPQEGHAPAGLGGDDRGHQSAELVVLPGGSRDDDLRRVPARSVFVELVGEEPYQRLVD